MVAILKENNMYNDMSLEDLIKVTKTIFYQDKRYNTFCRTEFGYFNPKVLIPINLLNGSRISYNPYGTKRSYSTLCSNKTYKVLFFR